jgi:regulator of nucleoside diphosphate kinase
MSSLPEIFICSTDAQQLNRLLSEQSKREQAAQSALELSTKLFEAQVVAPEVLPYGTVRLHSTVTYEELPTRTRRRVTLVNPREADAGAGRISVLSPVGRALLGHALGRVVDLVLPTGRQVAVRVVDVAPPQVDRVDESVFA